MYRNINNYYFNRPNYGYAYANPYRMNFSRSYPRVVVYNGQQNFNKFTDFVKKHGREAALATALLAAGIPGAKSAGKVIGEHTVPLTHEITRPVTATPPIEGGERLFYVTEGPYPFGVYGEGKRGIISKREYHKTRDGNVFQASSSMTGKKKIRDAEADTKADIERLKKHHWPGADYSLAFP